MHLMTMTFPARRVLAVLVATAALCVAVAALPSGSGSALLNRVAPQSAQAFQGGWSGDHVWFKITRGEIFAGAATGICRYFAGPIGWYVCPPIAAAVRQIVGGSSGVWVEVYRSGWYRYGTW